MVAKKKKSKKSSIRANFWAFISVGWQKIRGWRWWWRWPAYIVIFLIVFFSLSSLVDRLYRPIKHPVYGVSFSIPYAQELGNDWQANYEALLKDQGFKHLRIMSYWWAIEPQDGKYDFKDLDWQFDQANKYGAKVSLAMGLRQPRWPECHEPEWAAQLPAESPQWRSKLYTYMRAVVERYKDNPALESYQLENEAANGWFGYCRGGVAPKSRLNMEFSLMKAWDTGHPTWMSLGDEHGLPVGTPVPDAYGFSIYRIVYSTNTPIHFYVTYPITIWYHRTRAFIITKLHHRPVYIHELQLEPWGSKATKELSIAEQDKSMNVSQMHKSILYGRKTGIKTEYMWGSEWWYWRKTSLHDPGPWNAIKEELQAANQP
jgi:hypothetical protein